MSDREELQALRRLAELEAKAAGTPAAAPAPEATKPERGIGEELVRQVGLTLRHGATGLARTAEVVTEPIRQNITDPIARALQPRGLSDLVTGAQPAQGQPLSQTVEQWADMLGLPRPENATERVVGEASQLVAGAGGMAGAAGRLGLLPLAANPGTQAISAAGSGLAGGTAKENDVGAGGQFLASLAGGVAAPTVLARIAAPNTSQQVRTLLNEGITPTPGQILGGAAGRIEEKLMSVPLLGDAIHAGRQRAVGELNTAVANRALAPVGETLPAGLRGRAAVAHIGERLGQGFNEVLDTPGLRIYADQPFQQAVQTVRGMFANGAVDPAIANRFEQLIQAKVLGKFQGQGAMTGQTMKQVESDLGDLAAGFSADSQSDVRTLGRALLEVQDQLRQAVGRQNPQVAERLDGLREGWANFVRMRQAAASLGAQEGEFSPAQILNAVKATDRSKGKSQFARGDALLQDLAEPAKTVMGSKVPDSGTAGRLAAGGGLLALANATPVGAAAATAPSLMYTPMGQRLMATVLARRPEALQQLAQQPGGMLPIESLILPPLLLGAP